MAALPQRHAVSFHITVTRDHGRDATTRRVFTRL
jgi:hypothetical protein